MQASLHRVIVPDVASLPLEDTLDVIDYILAEEDVHPVAVWQLEKLLSDGGSAWRATSGGLQRRIDSTAQATADSVIGTQTRASRHLADAWQRAWGRDPDASGAYREAVRAVEAGYQDIVSPRNERATLGTIIADIGNKPEKLRVRLGGDEADGNVDRLGAMLEMLWKSQFDRHGTADDDVPLNVTLDEARDAVVLSSTLVHLAQDGGVTTRESW